MTAAYASAQNVFVRSHEASGKLLIDFARNPKDFAVNRYVTVQPAKKIAGYYLKMTVEEAGRLIDSELDNFVWYDGDPAPEGLEGKESHEWLPFECRRYSYPVTLGDLTIDQADWDIIAQYSRIKAQQAMTARTQLVYNQLVTAANWDATHILDVVTGITGNLGTWAQSTSARQDIKRSLITAKELILDDTLGAVKEEDFQLVIGSGLAKELSLTQEIVEYIKHSPAALAQIKGELQGSNPNVMYGLPNTLYGVPLVVDKTRKVTSRKGAATTARASVYSSDYAFLLSRPGELEAPASGPNFSTVTIFAVEEMTAETKRDDDNRRTKCRVVENVVAKVTAPAAGVWFTNCD
jgi:hypothetical protein